MISCRNKEWTYCNLHRLVWKMCQTLVYLSLLHCLMPDDTLPGLRHSTYCRQVSASLSGVHPERLPPSHNAAYFHVLRVHLQAESCELLEAMSALEPLSWGWRLYNGRYESVKSDQPIAPDDILKVVRCACHKCDTGRCSCRSSGLKCVAACHHCQLLQFWSPGSGHTRQVIAMLMHKN